MDTKPAPEQLDPGRRLKEETRHVFELQHAYLQHLLLVSSSTLSIVISLHTYTDSPLCIRLVFATSVVLLSIGTLSGLVALYSQKQIPERARRLYFDEYIKTLQGLEPSPVIVLKTRTPKICETTTLYTFALSILSLATYAIMRAFVG